MKKFLLMFIFCLFFSCGAAQDFFPENFSENFFEAAEENFSREIFSENFPENFRENSFNDATHEIFPRENFFDDADATRHAILHISYDEFIFSAKNPRRFEIDGTIRAGVVPHHTTAATLISGFFSRAAKFSYETVLIVAPNHANEFANIILSDRDWEIGGGVFANKKFARELLDARGLDAAISHAHVENEHAVGVLIPYVNYFLPDAKVAPVLISASTRFDEIVNLLLQIEKFIDDSRENILLVASVDFSHFLTAAEAAEKDRETAAAIFAGDLRKIYTMKDDFLDSPASLIIFLKYLNARGITPKIVCNTDATEFLGALDETTSYMVIVGADAE